VVGRRGGLPWAGDSCRIAAFVRVCKHARAVYPTTDAFNDHVAWAYSLTRDGLSVTFDVLK
jgi:hypothetical protein